MALKDRLPKTLQKFFAPSDSGGSFISRWATPSGERNLLHRYQGYVYTCVSAIAEDVAMIDLEAYRKLDNGDLVKLDNHPLLRALETPNPLMSKYQLIEMTQTHIELTGESFWYMEIGELTGKPKSFYLLPPERMTVAIDRNSALPRIAGYVFTKDNGQKIPLEENEVVHFKTPNPWDSFRGYGTLEAALTYVMTEKYASDYTKNYIYNNAMPAGIVSLKNNMDVEKFNDLKRQWKQEYGTIDKAGKTAFINGVDVNFTQVGSTLSQSALTELKQMTRDDIMTMYRVSKPILGILEDVNLASAKTAEYVFMSRVIDPKMARLVDTLQPLLKRWETPTQKLVLGYTNPVPEDIDNKIKGYQAGLNNWLTVNEIRTQEGLEEVDGGDVLQIPLNLVPLGQPPAPDTATKGHTVIKRSRQEVVVEQKATKQQKGENFRLQLIANQQQWAKRFNKAIDKLLEGQKQEILTNWKITTSKAFNEYSFNEQEWNRQYTDTITPLAYELAKEQGAVALAFAGADNLEFELNNKVRDVVNDRIVRMAQGFNEDTIKMLSKTIAEGVNKGESIGQIKKRIETVFNESKGYRAERIARTETLNASNSAAVEAYAQTGYIRKMEWLADGQACEYCRAMNGKVVSITSNFVPFGGSITGVDGGVFQANYSEIKNPPAHPNCECTVIPVVE